MRPDGDVYDAEAEKKAKHAARQAKHVRNKEEAQRTTGTGFVEKDAVRGFAAEDLGTTELDQVVEFSETFQRMLRKNGVFNRWRCRTPSEHATWAAFVDRGGPWQQHCNRERWRRCRRPQLSAVQRRERWLTPCERAAMGRARPSGKRP